MVSETITTVAIVVLAIIVIAVVILIIVDILTGRKIANSVCKAVGEWLDPALWTLAGEYIFKPLFGGYPRPSHMICDLALPF